MIDVHIVGGGPAGCFAGISACLSGKNALISEEHAQIGKPEACSGLISKSGLDSLGIDYRGAVLNSITSARFACGNEQMTIRPREETAVLVCRETLDRMASDKYLSLGGKLELSKKVTREFASKNIVGADGPSSAVAERFGFPKIGSFVHCAQGVFKHRCEDSHQAKIILSSSIAPGFFAWIIPINEYVAKAGLGVRKGHPLLSLRSFARKYSLGAPREEFCAVIPTSVRGKIGMQKSGYNVCLAGDSAGQVKATTGGGVYFGSHAGMIAGRNASDPEGYEKEWRSCFGLDLQMHRVLRSTLDLWGGEPHPFLFSVAKAAFFDDLLSKRGRMDRLSRMLDMSLLGEYAKIASNRLLVGK